MKVLILKPSSLGDVVQALPVLRLIKRARPEAEIFWWVDSNLAPLLEDDPDLAGIIPFERRGWNKPARWRKAAREIRWLRAQRFDWVIDLQCLARSGAFAWLANGQFTIGLDEPREGARGFYDVIVRRPTAQTHAVDWYLGVLPPLGVPVHRDFVWLPERPQVAAQLREKWRMERGRWVVFQPGARWPSKCWPVEHFMELAQILTAAQPDLRVAILGGNAERALGEKIAGAIPQRGLNLAGQLSLPEMVEWIRMSELMVSNDTGPMHVGAALGKPVVAIFGPTDPRRTGPYGQVEAVLRQPPPCAPCFRQECHYFKPLECLRAITPAMVWAEVQRRLAARPGHISGKSGKS